MSTAKRSRGRQAEAGTAPSLPPSKKAKTSTNSSGLAFLTDENARSKKTLSANYVNGKKSAKHNRVDESKAVVGQREADAPEVVEISSGAEESSDYHSSDDEEDDQPKALTNGSGDADAVMADADADAEAEGPSFGDLLQASHPETIDVQAAFADRAQGTQALVPTTADRTLTAPTATSLGTVLTQALRTNDRDLLESCFQMTDIPSIRSTIQRLQSPLVASLLQRLAERLHKRPGRAGNLMVWVQWSLVSHGGYLAGQPDVLKKLKTLSRVIKERANGLQSLVTLKGKLDMLNAQIDLRKSIQDARDGRFDSDDEQEAGVIYVEGEDDSSDDDAQSSDAEDLPMANGVDHETSDDEEEAGEGMFDDEAEETSDDEGEELSEDDDESDEVDGEEDDESESDDEAPAPVKASRTQQRPAARRR